MAAPACCYHDQSYWASRYAAEGESTFEWYASAAELLPLLQHHAARRARGPTAAAGPGLRRQRAAGGAGGARGRARGARGDRLLRLFDA